MFNHVLTGINWLHTLIAAIAFFILGFLWYSVLFGKKWVALHKIDMNAPDAKKGMGTLFGSSFVLMFIYCVGMAMLIQVLPAIDCVGGIKLGLLLSVTFSATVVGINYLYQKKPFALFLIDAGYYIIGAAIAGAILAGWR